jgi:hypothetical protein
VPDPFASTQAGIDSPASNVFDITPADGADLALFARAIRVGGSGTLKIDAAQSGTVTLTVFAGEVVPIRTRRVYATGTTATGLVGLY